MTPGMIVREVLGEKRFAVVGRLWRSMFVDLEKVVDSFAPLEPGAEILDIGGGDGELENVLLARHSSARITMIDLGQRIGSGLRPEFRPRVEILPGTSIRACKALGRRPPSLVIVSDVVHHVPAPAREEFFRDIRDLLEGHPATMIVKDVQPGSLHAGFAWFADRYISGDRNVSFMSDDDVERLVRSVFPGIRCERTDLLVRNPPNYCLRFMKT